MSEVEPMTDKERQECADVVQSAVREVFRIKKELQRLADATPQSERHQLDQEVAELRERALWEVVSSFPSLAALVYDLNYRLRESE